MRGQKACSREDNLCKDTIKLSSIMVKLTTKKKRLAIQIEMFKCQNIRIRKYQWLKCHHFFLLNWEKRSVQCHISPSGTAIKTQTAFNTFGKTLQTANVLVLDYYPDTAEGVRVNVISSKKTAAEQPQKWVQLGEEDGERAAGLDMLMLTLLLMQP